MGFSSPDTLNLLSRTLVVTILLWIITILFILAIIALLCYMYSSSESPSSTTATIKEEMANNEPETTMELSTKSMANPEQNIDNSVNQPTNQIYYLMSMEACKKAKDAGRHPSNISFCCTLICLYNLDINIPVLPNGFTIFHCSCVSGSYILVSTLMSMANLNKLTHHGESPLHLAVYVATHTNHRNSNDGHINVVRCLLENGCNVNHSNDAGVTALHQASQSGCQKLTKLLLDYGADPNAQETIV